MACFLCSGSTLSKGSSQVLSLTTIFDYLKLNDISFVRSTFCGNCSQVCNNLTSLILELEVVKMKLSDGMGDFKNLIKFNKWDRDTSAIDHQNILRKTKEQCLKYLKAEKQPTINPKRINTPDRGIRLKNPVNDPNISSSTPSAHSDSHSGCFSCHYCSYLKIEPKFDTKEDLSRHKLIAHTPQIFGKSRPRKMHFADYRKCLDDLIENEVISTTRRVRDKKFSVCICNYCPSNVMKYFNQNTMYIHLMEYHRLQITRKLEKALSDLMEEDEEQMSEDESETDGSEQSATEFLRRKSYRKRASLKRPLRKSRNSSTSKYSSSEHEDEVIGRNKQNGKKRKATKLVSSSSSSSCSILSSTSNSSPSLSSSRLSPAKKKKTLDSLSDKSDSLFSVIPRDRVLTRRRLKF